MSLTQKYLVRRDTNAWIMQVWISFGVAIFSCAIGVWNVPSQELDRAFLATGFFFCLFTCFALAKMIRDNRDEKVDTGAWVITVWVGFFVAMTLTAWGLFRLAIGNWEKGYMAVAWLFMVSSAFTVAKTIRDKMEADLMEAASNLDRHEAEDAEVK